MLMEMLCKTEQDSIVFFCTDYPTSYDNTRFFKMHRVLQKAPLRHESLTC